MCLTLQGADVWGFGGRREPGRLSAEPDTSEQVTIPSEEESKVSCTVTG